MYDPIRYCLVYNLYQVFSECSAWNTRAIFAGCELGFSLKGLSESLLLVVVVSRSHGMLPSSSVLHHNLVLLPKFVKQAE